MTRPLRIHGGLALPRHKPGLDRPILTVPLPPQLIYPLLGYGERCLHPHVAVAEHVQPGTLLADGLRASAAGTVLAIEPRAVLNARVERTSCIVIATHSPGNVGDGELPHGQAFEGVAASDGKAMRAVLMAAGIDGQGGAGFPTAAKLRAVQAVGCEQLVINACECEPGIACDEALLQERAADVVAAAERLVRWLNPRHVCITIEHDKRAALTALRKALAPGSRIRTLLFEPIYPSGAEAPLLARVRTSQGLPALPAGCRPVQAGALCLNVATVHALGQALLGKPASSRIVTVSGEERTRDVNVRATFGTPLGWLLAHTGFAVADQPSADGLRLRIGGPLSGFETSALDAPITATTHAIHVAAPERQTVAPPASRPCIRCGECAPVCPVKLQPQLLHWHANASDAGALQRHGMDRCIECGCCDVVCPSALPLTAGFRRARAALRADRERAGDAARADALVRRRTERLEREEQRRCETAPHKPLTSVDAALARVKERAAQRGGVRSTKEPR